MLALLKLKEILTYPYSNETEYSKNLLRQAHSAMVFALSNAYERDLLPKNFGNNPDPLDTYSQAIIDYYEDLINQSSDQINIAKYTVEQAHVYRISGHYTNALALLNSGNAEAFTNTPYWICIVENEFEYLSGNISELQFMDNMTSCESMFQARRRNIILKERSMSMELDNSLQVYPNPSQGYFNVTLIENSARSYELYNSYGSKVQTNVIPLDGTAFVVDARHLPKGVYLIKVQTSIGKIVSSKIIID